MAGWDGKASQAGADQPKRTAKLTIMTAVAGTMGLFILLTIGSALTSLKLSSTAAAILGEQPRAIERMSDVKDLEKSMVGLDVTMNRYLASVNLEDKKAFFDGEKQAKALLEKMERRDPKVQPLASAFNAWSEAASKSMQLWSITREAEEAHKALGRSVLIPRQSSSGSMPGVKNRRLGSSQPRAFKSWCWH